MRAKAHIRRQSQLSKNPSPRLGGKAVASATKCEFYTPQFRRQAPAKKILKIFRKARFFPPRPRPFGRGPVKRKASYSTQAKTKSKTSAKKNAQHAAPWPFFFPPSPPGKVCRLCRRRGRIASSSAKTGLSTLACDRALWPPVAPLAPSLEPDRIRRFDRQGRPREIGAQAGNEIKIGSGGLKGEKRRRRARQTEPDGRRAKRARRRLRACGRMQKGPRKRAFFGKPRDEH